MRPLASQAQAARSNSARRWLAAAVVLGLPVVVVQADTDVSRGLSRWSAWRSPSPRSSDAEGSASGIAHELDATASWSRHSSRFLDAMYKSFRGEALHAAFPPVGSTNVAKSGSLLRVRTYNATLPTDNAPVTACVAWSEPAPGDSIDGALSVVGRYNAVMDRALAVVERATPGDEAVDSLRQQSEATKASLEHALRSLKADVTEMQLRLEESRDENSSRTAISSQREQYYMATERFESELARIRQQHKEREDALQRLLESEREKSALQTEAAVRRVRILEAQAAEERVRRQILLRSAQEEELARSRREVWRLRAEVRALRMEVGDLHLSLGVDNASKVGPALRVIDHVDHPTEVRLRGGFSFSALRSVQALLKFALLSLVMVSNGPLLFGMVPANLHLLPLAALREAGRKEGKTFEVLNSDAAPEDRCGTSQERIGSRELLTARSRLFLAQVDWFVGGIHSMNHRQGHGD